MEEAKTLLVINAIVDKQNMAKLQEYLGSVMQVFGKNGGKPIGRYKVVEDLEGENSPEMIAMIAFKDTQTIRDMINGEDYQGLEEARSKVFKKLNLVICNEL
jgi:uncharacterized protein (DUF1330 family)